MKKILVILACVAMLFSFASCDNNNGGAADYINRAKLASDAMAIIKTELDKGAALTGWTLVADGNNAAKATYAFEASSDYETGYLVGEVTVRFASEKAATTAQTITEASISTEGMKFYKGDGIYDFAVSGPLAVTAGTLTVPEGEAAPTVADVDINTDNYSEQLSFDLFGSVATADVFKAGKITSAEQAAADALAQGYVTKITEAFDGATVSEVAAACGTQREMVRTTQPLYTQCPSSSVREMQPRMLL